MVKISVLIVVLALATVFFLQNTGPSVVHVPFGRPYQLGLIYLLLIAFCAGAITTIIVVTIVNHSLKKRREMNEAEKMSYDLIEEE